MMLASCCQGPSSAGIGRLKRHERAYVAFINDAHRVMGSFNQHGHFRFGTASHLPHWRFNHELQAMARLTDFLQPFIKLPARTQKSQEGVGSNIADISLGLHVPLIDENYWPSWPALSITTALLIPTGVAAGDHGIFEAESLTSMGDYDLSLSAMAQKTFGGLVTGLGYGISFSPSRFKKQSYHKGIAHMPSLAFSFSPHDKAQMQANVTPTFYSPAIVNKKALPHSSRRELGLSLGYSLMLHSHITINTTIGTHVPISYLGKNSGADMFAAIGIRMGVF